MIRLILLAAVVALGLGLAGATPSPSLAAADRDGDGLPNTWETGTAPGGLNIKKMGADPNRKDIFVEIDFRGKTVRSQVTCQHLDALFNAFRNAPVGNPNGKKGINLHLDANKVCPSRSYKLGGSNLFNPQQKGAGGCAETNFDLTFQPGAGGAKMADNRIQVFHHAAIVAQICSGSYGVAQQPGSRLLVSTAGDIATTFMHELGHNLGLGHDATNTPHPDGVEWGVQPNHLSSMGQGLHKSNDGNLFIPVIDYQRFAMPRIDERHLDEGEGVGGPPEAHKFMTTWECAISYNVGWPAREGPLNWNCSQDVMFFDTFEPGSDYTLDLNRDGRFGWLPATFNEWKVLVYDGGAIGGFRTADTGRVIIDH